MDGTGNLLRLEALSGSLESADIFCETYEKALKKAKKEGNIKQIKELRKIVYAEFLFVLRQWLKEEARLKDIEQAGGIQ